MSTINLTFPKTICRLAHNPYGRKIYKEQVEEHIDFSGQNTIVFPPEIIRASSSFVQGFFTDIIEHIGYEHIREHISIESNNSSLINSIWDNLY